MKLKATTAFGMVAVLAMAAIAGEDSSPKFEAFRTTLNGAEQVSATYTITTVGGSTSEQILSMAKPNKLRFETGETLIIADGAKVTTLDKGSNSFSVADQTEDNLLGLFDTSVPALWKPFFKLNVATGFASVKDSGSKTRGGKTLNVVDVRVDDKGTETAKYYTDSANNLAQAEFNKLTNAGSTTTVLNVKDYATSNVSADLFAFKAPSGAREVKPSDGLGIWQKDFKQALALANSTGKMVMVDFMATWCGPCKMMDAEVFHSEAFKKVAKDLVLVKVDVDVHTDIAKKYGVEAMPTVKFLRGDGSVVHEFVGYGGPDQVYGEIAKAKGMF